MVRILTNKFSKFSFNHNFSLSDSFVILFVTFLPFALFHFFLSSAAIERKLDGLCRGGGKRRPCSGHVIAFPNLRVVGICTNETGRS